MPRRDLKSLIKHEVGLVLVSASPPEAIIKPMQNICSVAFADVASLRYSGTRG